MPSDQQAPATKQDIQQFVEHIQRLIADMEQRLTKESEETRRHFDVVAENLHYDFKGALNDKIQNHENRIVHLEEHVGLAA
ncbi:hypothetical protein A3D12_01660 [Candidatus Peribacteria bacterium RIFCSPHIGHO2_02_FULL_55_24]|nr:MAG: hypothetical protein A3D12_01660 [Candidatus Peribacteria bacterium RIFCSPHIGHO2_02_FULL_55_24]OGJ64886.1 MAG: hypothetical protein A3E47_03210 [Candidatus Peribacteria bacterium RIFCSPHIGHO2_12_FULL_54_10]